MEICIKGEKRLIFPDESAIIKAIRWKNMGNETEKTRFFTSEL